MSFAFAPYELSGTVYGVLLNHRPAVEAMGDAVHQPPYLKPPNAPVLFIKPRNTLSRDGQPVVIPRDPGQVEISAQLGIVIGALYTRVSATKALD